MAGKDSAAGPINGQMSWTVTKALAPERNRLGKWKEKVEAFAYNIISNVNYLHEYIVTRFFKIKDLLVRRYCGVNTMRRINVYLIQINS